MNQKTKQAIDVFVEHTPKYIEDPIHCTDRQREFDIAIATFEANDLLSDVNEYLQNLLQENDFLHTEKLTKVVKHDIELLVEFLRYQKK